MYIQELGYTPKTGKGIRAYPTVVYAHWNNDDNSFFRPSTNSIYYGDGGVWDSTDSDVIVHEYGHAIQIDQNMCYAITGGDMDAIGEGFGDYL